MKKSLRKQNNLNRFESVKRFLLENADAIEKEATRQHIVYLGEDKLRGQVALAEVAMGKGRVVLFGFRPQHRGQAWATLPLVWNVLSSAAAGSSE